MDGDEECMCNGLRDSSRFRWSLKLELCVVISTGQGREVVHVRVRAGLNGVLLPVLSAPWPNPRGLAQAQPREPDTLSGLLALINCSTHVISISPRSQMALFHSRPFLRVRHFWMTSRFTSLRFLNLHSIT